LYNLAGELAVTLEEQVNSTGFQRTPWDIQKAAPGVYFYRLSIEENGKKRSTGMHKLVVVN
ncbi:MAG: hypothetical protein HGA76_09960, partial [Candidatus Firestonebacteria bacterium]|nr:hypothetical protein [Candidatus Firestonebacteria bacterium]